MKNKFLSAERKEWFIWSCMFIVSMILISLFIYVVMGITYKAHVDQIKQRARDSLAHLQYIIPRLKSESIQEYIQSVYPQSETFSYMLVMDRNGRAIAHSNPERKGMSFYDIGLKKVFETGRNVEQIYIRDADNPSSPYHGEKTIDILAPYYYPKGHLTGAVNIGISLKSINQLYMNYLWVTLAGICLWIFLIAIYVFTKFRHLSEKKQAEIMSASREILRSLINATNEVLLLIDTEGTILVANEVLAQRLGKNIEELIGTSQYNYFPPDVAKYRKEQYDKAARTGKPVHFEDERAGRVNEIFAYPVFDNEARISALAIFAKDITERKSTEKEREKLILELQEALENVKKLSGLLPICASCKKIRNDMGYWEQIEMYIKDHSEADFSHSICPECAEKLYPGYYKKK